MYTYITVSFSIFVQAEREIEKTALRKGLPYMHLNYIPSQSLESTQQNKLHYTIYL